MNLYIEAITEIIKAQEEIIGPLAYDQAKKITGLQVTEDGKISLSGDGKKILGSLVSQYSQFFGQASIEVCKEAIRDIESRLTANDLPDILK